jgi:hypothetical protein
MKRGILFLLFFSTAGFLCFAGPSRGDSTEAPAEPSEKQSIAGKIDEVILFDPVKEQRLEISVIDDKNEKITFYLNKSSALYGADKKNILLRKIRKGDPVFVEYTKQPDGNLAVSFTLTEKQAN